MITSTSTSTSTSATPTTTCYSPALISASNAPVGPVMRSGWSSGMPSRLGISVTTSSWSGFLYAILFSAHTSTPLGPSVSPIARKKWG
eukprot:2967716-Rhodomonas_salina.4